MSAKYYHTEDDVRYICPFCECDYSTVRLNIRVEYQYGLVWQVAYCSVCNQEVDRDEIHVREEDNGGAK